MHEKLDARNPFHGVAYGSTALNCVLPCICIISFGDFY
uniref:Uncharacterized protein n=1 Tax=Rhizophora mucronata TaxID=61149 RepID=A0A2P2QGS9_RHIMU